MSAILIAGAVAFAGPWAPPAAAQATLSPDAPSPLSPGRPESPPEAKDPGPGFDLSTKEGRAAKLDWLFARLPEADEAEAAKMELEIRGLWSRSGSDTMDLLLMRGRDALENHEVVKAIHHLTALTDHAPGFAEGWNMRATAFFMKGDLGMALADIERTLALEPRHFGALSGLGVILEQVGREKDALAAFRAAKELDPHLENVDEAISRLAHEVDGRDI